MLINTILRWVVVFFARLICLFLMGLFPVVAQAAITQFSSGLAYSGTLPFDALAGAGKDSSSTDSIVRTFDKVGYQVGYSLTQSDTSGVVKLQIGATTLPATYVGPPLPQIARFLLADIPSGAGGCQNISTLPLTPADIAAAVISGISTDGQTLVCVQPSPAGSATFNIAVSISGTAPNGATMAAPSVSYQSTNNPLSTTVTINNDGISTFGLPVMTISAAPRWNLAKQTFMGAQYVPGSGPLGQDGFVFSWNLGIYAQGSRKGLEAINGAYTISENFNDPNFPNAQWVTWNMVSPNIAANFSAAGQNGCGDWHREFFINTQYIDNDVYFPSDLGNTLINPAFRLPYQVARGGSCDQVAVNNLAKTATLTLSNTDFSLDVYPTQNGSASIVRLINPTNLDDSTNQWWVASKSVAIWAPVTDLPTPPSPNIKTLTNHVTLAATSVTGQVNLEPNLLDNSSASTANAQTSGTFSKIHTAYAFAYFNPLGLDAAPPDPNITSDSLVNQVGPGQLLNVRLIVTNTGTIALGAGHICDRLDNSRFTFFDASAAAYGTWNKDAGTGIISFTYAGVATPLTWRLGVGGTGTVGVGGTWANFNTVNNEYSNPVTSGSAQSDSACGDPARGEPNDGITWYSSVAALLAAEGPNGLQKITRVRGDYASLPPGVTVVGTYPQQTNATYTYSSTDNAPGAAFVAGTSTVGAMAVNQAIWQSNSPAIGTLGVLHDSDAVRIFSNEFIQINTSSSSNPISNSNVAAGSLVGFDVTVNASSTSNNHLTNVDVWVVMPNYMSYVAGSSTFGGAALPDPVCTNTGLPVALFPAATQVLAAGFSACHWVLLNQPVKRVTAGDVAANLPVLKFNELLSATTPAGVQLLNTSYASSTNNAKYPAIYGGGTPSPAATPVAATSKGFGCNAYYPCSFSNWTLTSSTTSGLLLSKQVNKGAVFLNNGVFSYTLNYAAIGAPLNGVRLIDVLPYNADGRGTNFVGTLQFAGPIANPVVGGLATMGDPTITLLYTNNAPANISLDPYAVGQVLNGLGSNTVTATNWCTVAQFGTVGCPVTIANATAFMALPKFTAPISGQLQAGDTYSLIVPVVAAGNTIGNIYNNRFIGDSPSLIARLPGSNSVSTTVIAPDLAVSKSIIATCVGVACVPTTYVAGTLIPPNAKIRYQISYSNNSYVSSKTNVVLSDMLPTQTAAAAVSNVTVVSGAITAPTTAILAGLAGGGATLSFPALAVLPARGTGVITFDVQTNAAAGTTVVNTAKLVSTEDPIGVVSSASVDVTNLLLSKATTTAKTIQNGIATYVITLQNVGVVAIDNLVVYDFLPFTGAVLNPANQFAYLPNSSVYGGGLPSTTIPTVSVAPTLLPYSSNINQQQVLWSFGTFVLAAGATATITFSANVGSTMAYGIYPNSMLVNYKVAGLAKNISLDNAALVEILAKPTINLSKVVKAFSDPVNGTNNPKFLPGAIAEYMVTATNSGGLADTVSIEDFVPLNTSLYVADLGVVGSGPIIFTPNNSGLTYQFLGLASLLDNVEFFNGTAWTAVPVAGADGCDALIRKIRIKPSGIFAGSTTAPVPSFALSFRVCLQ